MKNMKNWGQLVVGSILLLGLAGCTSSSERKTKEAFTGTPVLTPPPGFTMPPADNTAPAPK